MSIYFFRARFALVVCAITKSSCVSPRVPIPQLLYINAQLINEAKSFLFLIYLKEETMKGNGDGLTAMAVSFVCDALP